MKSQVGRVVEPTVVFVECGVEEATKLLIIRMEQSAGASERLKQLSVDEVLSDAADFGDDAVEGEVLGVGASVPTLKSDHQFAIRHHTPP